MAHMQQMLLAGSGTSLDAGDGGTVAAVDPSSPYDTTVGIRFNTDGSVEVRTTTNGATTWTAHGSWIDPESAASGNYSVRYTNRVGTEDFTTKAAAEDTFAAISAQRTWEWNETVTVDDNFTCDFQVRDDVGGLPTATESYTFDISNTV